MSKTNKQNRKTGENQRKMSQTVKNAINLALSKALKGSPKKGQGPKNRNRNQMRNKMKSRTKSRNTQPPFRAKTGNRLGMNNVKSKMVSFREELGSISGSANFFTTAYNINPGQASSFPWLALEAKQWEKYRFHKLTYIYTPQVTEFSTNGTGSVVIGFDADASDPPPNDLTHALNVTPRNFNLPCKNITLDIPQKCLNTLTDGYYVRPGNLPGQSDIKTYDCGVMNLSTIDNVNANAIGVLAVEYTCELFLPILEPTMGAPANNSVTYLVDPTTSLTSGSPYTCLYNQAASTAQSVTNGLNIVNASGILTPLPGNYVVTVTSSFFASSGAINDAITSFNKNTVVQFPIHGSNTNTFIGTAASTTQVTLMNSFFVSCNGTDTISMIVQLNYTGGTATVNSSILIVAA